MTVTADDLQYARQAWGKPKREPEQTAGKWSAIGTELKPVLGFFEIVRKIGERAAARGEKGEGGGFVWSIAEWQRFCRAVRENGHASFYGAAAFKTVANVETMLADGLDARQIHAALFWRSRKDDQEQAKVAEAERDHAQRTASASFESAVQEKMKDAKAREEAYRRVKADAESDDSRGRRNWRTAPEVPA